MVSPRAIEDLEDLREEGLHPSFDDIIRLNALGLRLDSSRETTFANAPRIGWAGDVAIHQPTCQVEFWMMDVGEVIAADRETVDSLWCFACAHARVPGFFENLFDADKIRTAVKDWYKGLRCTRDELTRAFRFAVYGDDPGGDIVPEETELAKEKANKSKKSFRQWNFERLDEDMMKARDTLNLTTAEMLTMTRSRIVGMLYAHAIIEGAEVKPDTATALVDYLTTLRAIRDRLTKEKKSDE